MMKKITAVLIAILLTTATVFSAYAAPADLASAGKTVITDENWSYEKVNVYGWEIDEYVGNAAVAELPWSFAKEYVTTIGDYAFNGNTTITSVTLTGKIESVGNYAFNGCTSLEQIVLFDSLTALGVGCFYGDGALTDINLGDTSIAAVPAYCFAECGISEIALPATCASIGNMAFYHCTDLVKIVIPDNVTEIADTAFTGCDNAVIYCNTDSFAHQHAAAHNIPFVLMDAPVEVTFILGDADGDGDVTILDSTKIQRVIAGLDPDPDGMIALRGTVDGDDELNIIHATTIQRFLADYATSAPIGTEVTRTIINSGV